MKLRSILAALLATVLLSTGAFAQTRAAASRNTRKPEPAVQLGSVARSKLLGQVRGAKSSLAPGGSVQRRALLSGKQIQPTHRRDYGRRNRR